MDWNDETIARLRQLWADGHSTAEIGRRMGVSKNSVVGKAHRLDLTGRPSPIRRTITGETVLQAPSPRRMTGPTLPSLASMPASGVPAPRVPTSPAVSAPAPQPVIPPPALRAVATRSARLVSCCWPIGEPGTKTFRFCDSDAAGGKPYCAEHAQIAYVKVRDRREEAA